MSKPCELCGSIFHYPYQCRLNPKTRKFIRHEAPKTRQKRVQTAKAWHEANPPDEYGYWDCYLKISPGCYVRVNLQTLNREHVKPKTRHPELKYEVTNIKPACPPCNALKESRDLENIKEYKET